MYLTPEIDFAPRNCQGKGFSGAFHIATMANYRAQSCLNLAKGAASTTELVEFCASCLCPWVMLVDSRSSRASMQVRSLLHSLPGFPVCFSLVAPSGASFGCSSTWTVPSVLQLHIDTENLCFSVLEASVRRFLPKKLVSAKAISRLAAAVFNLCADSNFLLAQSARQPQQETSADGGARVAARLEALSRAALRLLGLHRPKTGFVAHANNSTRFDVALSSEKAHRKHCNGTD